MNLGDALYRAISGRQSRTEIHDFAGALKWIGTRYSSKSEAARELGVPRSTFSRWLAGKQPKAGRAETITDTVKAMQRRVRLSPARERKLRRAPARDTMISGTIQYSSDVDDREVRIGIYLDPAVVNDLVDAFLAGAGPDDLHDIFHGAILDDGFYELTFEREGTSNWDIREVWGWV